MPSRKRNKGKERKAKKVELEVERIESVRAVIRSKWQGYVRGEHMINGQSIECNHGLDLTIPDDMNPGPVINFLDTFYINGAILGIIDNLKESFQARREVWDNERYRQMAINIFIAIGTNFLLQKDVTGDASNIANTSNEHKAVACAIVYLENYDGLSDFDSIIYTRGAATKMRDFNHNKGASSIRDDLKFYRKRTNCSCLKDMHLEARKTLPKLGICFHCRNVKERALLMVCSRCRFSQYCSRECQIANWSRHKCDCDNLCKQQHAKKR